MEELRIRPIRNGTVIDHIREGQALNVLSILGVDEDTRDVVSVGMNVRSERMGSKDIVKVEGREIESKEADIISLISPEATVNLVRDYEVQEKRDVSLPDEIVGVLRCPNSNCITNTREPVETKFNVSEVKSDAVRSETELRCDYCETVVRGDVTDHL
ncbi:MAG: aspartate carbamoyltransferase regulatory subunit [Halobacteria archaeon]|nr:aspartate carbamoyltransferase regulatory subunit [Halobacteria archaeon]